MNTLIYLTIFFITILTTRKVYIDYLKSGGDLIDFRKLKRIPKLIKESRKKKDVILNEEFKKDNISTTDN